MGPGQASLFEGYPAGRPAAFRAGRALSLSLFIPPINDHDIGFKERVRARCLPVGPKCPACGVSPTRPQMYNPKTTTDWEDWVAMQARNQLRRVHLEQDFILPIKGCRLLVTVRFTRRKPSSYPKSVVHNIRKPDVDNLVKSLLDGLVKGDIISDDSMVTDERVMKRYPEPGHPIGVEVDLTAIQI